MNEERKNIVMKNLLFIKKTNVDEEDTTYVVHMDSLAPPIAIMLAIIDKEQLPVQVIKDDSAVDILSVIEEVKELKEQLDLVKGAEKIYTGKGYNSTIKKLELDETLSKETLIRKIQAEIDNSLRELSFEEQCALFEKSYISLNSEEKQLFSIKVIEEMIKGGNDNNGNH